MVPDVWKGIYYPSYIPAQYEIMWSSEVYPCIELRKSDGGQIILMEMDEDTYATTGTEGGTITVISIQGKDAYLLDGIDNGIHATNIIWAMDDKWFQVITYNIDTSETIKIAESVRKIIK